MARKVVIDIDSQSLQCLDGDRVELTFDVSTARNGVGQQQGSMQTPLGEHIVRAKIGSDQALNTVFVGRRPTGEIWCPEMHKHFPGRDWILTRILWLSGTEQGFNRLGSVDSMRRYIYIHGTPDEDAIGKPVSHGCVRMKNADVVSLFEWVEVGTPIEIRQGSAA